ncbi:hypothetical protein DQ226_17655, partial [Dietzia maris]
MVSSHRVGCLWKRKGATCRPTCVANVNDVHRAGAKTGHDGSAGTVHANSPTELPARLEALGALGGLDRAALSAQVAASLRVVVGMRRLPTGGGASTRSGWCGARRTGSSWTRPGAPTVGGSRPRGPGRGARGRGTALLGGCRRA